MQQKKDGPVISVVVAVYNGAKTLQRCIDSIAGQSYPNKELIIIDGQSTDGTIDLLKKNHDKITFWISEPDSGIYDALNKGVACAQGEWILFLGSDDHLFHARVLEEVSDHLKKIPAPVQIAYAKVLILDTEGRRVCVLGKPWDKESNRFLQIMLNMPHQGVFHRRRLFEQHGMFDESLRIVADKEILVRGLKEDDPVFYLDIIVSVMQQGGISSDIKNSFIVLREHHYIAKKHAQKLPFWYWFSALAKACIRSAMFKGLGERRTMKILNYYSFLKRKKESGETVRRSEGVLP